MDCILAGVSTANHSAASCYTLVNEVWIVTIGHGSMKGQRTVALATFVEILFVVRRPKSAFHGTACFSTAWEGASDPCDEPRCPTVHVCTWRGLHTEVIHVLTAPLGLATDQICIFAIHTICEALLARVIAGGEDATKCLTPRLVKTHLPANSTALAVLPTPTC